MKPILAEAVRGYRYIMRLQAMECLCPLNNLRLLRGVEVESGGQSAEREAPTSAPRFALHSPLPRGCFEDDDYCLRALRAGYRAVIARDAFIHHHGGSTFRGSGVDFAAVMRRNEEMFRAKWGCARREGRAGRRLAADAEGNRDFGMHYRPR